MIVEKKNKQNTWSHIKIGIVMLLLSALFVLFRSYSTSFLFPDIYGNDSAQFQIVGKMWAKGRLPYTECFDHKGPVIFLINMIGYLFTGNSTGILMIQIVFMFFSLIALYCICKKSKYWFLIIPASTFTIAFNYAEGNLTGEYCLPFLSYSMYLQLKYVRGVAKEHDPKAAFFYGISFAICLLTRLSNAIPVVAGVIVIIFCLIKTGQWKNFLKNMNAFLIGILILVCPFGIYFGMKGHLYELYFGTVGFNLLYQKKITSWMIGAELKTFMQFAIVYIAYITIFISAVLAIILREYKLTWYCVILAMAESWLFLNGAGFSQYGIIAIPDITLFWTLLLELGKEKQSKIISRLSVLAVCVYLLFAGGRMIDRIVDNMTQEKDSAIEAIAELMGYIPEESRDSFIAYGDDMLKMVYLKYNIDPCYPYFAVQEWHASFSNIVREDIYRTFQSEKAQWILAGKNTDGIQDILDKHYKLLVEANEYRLYEHASLSTR